MDQVVLEQEIKPRRLLVEWIYAKPTSNKKRKDSIPCPACKQIKCYKHCNNCGKDIFFKKNDWGRWMCYEEMTQDLHKCMQKGTRDGKFKDVNLKREQVTWTPFSTDYFYDTCVVQDRELIAKKQAKIALYDKLTGYGYVNRNKTLANYLLAKKWEHHSFEY